MMQENSTDVFSECKSLFELTNKTADDHIAFYKNKQTMSTSELFDIWKNLSNQAETFDKHDWTQNWINWHKNMPGFIGHKYEAKFLIQWFLTDVLETLVSRLVRDYADLTKQKTEPESEGIPELIRQEIRRQIRLELSKNKKNQKI